MEGRGANLKKVRQQATSRTKTRNISNQIQPSIATSPVLAQEEQPYIGNASLFLEPTNNPSPAITNPQELRTALTPMSPVGIDNINPEPEDPESGRFLASLIAQGLTGFGTGIMGGSSQDILRSTGMFDRMRESDINRQDRLKQSELLRTERLGEKQERLAEIKKREEQAKSLTDPNSEESKRDRLLYEKVLKTKIPEEVTAFDLRNRPEIVRSLMTQAEQSRLAAMPRGGGIGAVKEEKRKEPTEAERLSLGFAKRTESSDKVLNDLENKFINKEGGFSPSSEFPFAPERLKSESRKNYEAAQKDFVGAILRKESGAAISDEEFKRESEKFFPLPGDTPANIAYKQLLRKQAINNLKTSANVRYVRDNQTGETIEIDPFGNILRRYKE